MSQKLIFNNDIEGCLATIVEELKPSSVVVVTDENVAPLLPPSLGYEVVTIPAGDDNKTVATVADVWARFSALVVTRHSLVVNIGGGVVTDLGGFASATFKRGVPFVNIPTTLLGAVDAAVGGKTGVNLGQLKNEVGAFCPAVAVIISTRFFDTLPREERLSGEAEMLKHALLTSTEAVARFLNSDLDLELLRESVLVKERIVEIDPTEKGLRKALNLGHTAGHAIESLALKRGNPVPHGYAVAWGLVVALVLSHTKLSFPSSLLHTVAAHVKNCYPVPPVKCDDYDTLIELMRHDKKNIAPGEIRFTLLADAGRPEIDAVCTPDEINTALDIMRDLLQ